MCVNLLQHFRDSLAIRMGKHKLSYLLIYLLTGKLNNTVAYWLVATTQRIQCAIYVCHYQWCSLKLVEGHQTTLNVVSRSWRHL